MLFNFEFNFWDNLFALLSILTSSITAVFVYRFSKRLTATDRYQHEVIITKEIHKIGFDKDVILANVLKYNPLRDDGANETYYKQRAGLYTIIPEYGVQFILTGTDKRIPVDLVPFEWIEYIRDHDSEDNKFILVCRFNGVKWYKNFKSPFKEIAYMYKNPNFDSSRDPSFMKLMTLEPKNK